MARSRESPSEEVILAWPGHLPGKSAHDCIQRYRTALLAGQ